MADLIYNKGIATENATENAFDILSSPPCFVKVIGITTDRVAEPITPPLTVINFPAYTMGYQAAKMLISQLNQKPLANDQILLPPELIVRKSTGPARTGDNHK